MKLHLQILMTISFLFTATMGLAKDYVIYSIGQSLPMGYEKEVIKKNYYVDIGETQGVKEGTLLDVYRTLSVLDPYTSKKRYDYSVKIAELKVIHSESLASIGILTKKSSDLETPLLDIDGIMIGDKVNIHLRK